MPFVKGVSGNPGGQVKTPRAAVILAQEQARSRLPFVLGRLMAIVRRGGDKEAVAASALMLRIAGVPLNTEATAQPASQPPANFQHMTATDIDAILASKSQDQRAS